MLLEPDWDGDPVVITMDSGDRSKLAIWIFVIVVVTMLLLALYGYMSGAWQTYDALPHQRTGTVVEPG